MSSFPWLAVGIGAGGLIGLIWWRNRQAEQTPPPGADKCELARAAAEAVLPGSGGAAYAACKALGSLDPTDFGFHDSNEDANNEIAGKGKSNAQLNGEVDLPNKVGGALAGDVLRFTNGCVPFEGAEGWEKCAPGTQSMWYSQSHEHVVDGYDYSIPAFRTPEDRQKYLDQWWDFEPPLAGAMQGEIRVVRSALLTGSTRPSAPDPATTGQGGKDGFHGFVKGKPVTCPAGQAPALWDKDGNPVIDHRTGDIPCVPEGKLDFSSSDYAPPPVSSGSGPIASFETDGCVNAASSAERPGYAWVAAANGVPGHWAPICASAEQNDITVRAAKRGRLAGM